MAFEIINLLSYLLLNAYIFKVSAYGTDACIQFVVPPLSDCSNMLNCKKRLLQLINVCDLSLSLVNW